MAKLGTHDPALRRAKSLLQAEQSHRVDACAFRGEPARARCDRCNRHMCEAHLVQRAQIGWVTYTYIGPQFLLVLPWKRYQRVATWTVCPACARQLEATESSARKQDCAELRTRRIWGAIAVVVWALVLGVGPAYEIATITQHILSHTGPGFRAAP